MSNLVVELVQFEYTIREQQKCDAKRRQKNQGKEISEAMKYE